ncbi:single-strand DNA specific exonuclease [Sporocytophaga myxococcoides]|uniref:Single-stranded-DNA-specific exonuclease RecJ n=1 Tax=Sporocytophaga myxococcoides TaxID=153721 RepID=A0A098LJM3_9BACT|nr:single-stranded-DNA-specific exonuclease RecJ [Sporocytophaga myxococcoides]GAL87175.1 single-strand DNA specific exonuclease [Sporocytophaga myxococcoides]
MEKRWVFKHVPSAQNIESLSQAININASLASLLIQRGINTFEEARDFFRPSLENLHDPYLMEDMDKAVSRLCEAMDNEEKILIYGDYDVDGTTSVTLVYGFLSNYYENLEFYIPDRYKEGYGISKTGIDWALENGFSLIISLDCGIKSLNEISYAAELGIDFIVCDHHKPGDMLPMACAVLDPKRADCNYPYKELSGCGVGFKLMQALCIDLGLEEELLFSFLDLLAVSIASDIVPITGENRILTYHGLKVLNESPRPGMKALIDISGVSKELTINNIVFGLGPRINAAGRIAHAKHAVHLLIAKDQDEADLLAEKINEKNKVRKDFDLNITDEAIRMIQEEVALDSKSTVLFKNDWHKGVIGIVASRCIEKFYRPTIILTENNGMATGSARSVDGFDVYEAIAKCSDLLEQFGGHTYAAGLTMKLENIKAFQERFEQVVSCDIRQEDLIPKLDVDLKIELSQINQKFYNILKQLAPFGPGNMDPVFISENVRDDGSARLLKDQHLKLRISQDGFNAIEAIGFNMVEPFKRISKGEPFNICYHIYENEFNGKKSLQLFIKDIKFVTN